MLAKKIGLFLGIYILLRLFSYFFPPETPLYASNPVNTIVGLAILLTTLYFLLTRNVAGWYIIALEIILGGAGGYLAVGPLSLRTALLVSSITIFFLQKIKDKKLVELFKREKVYWFISLLVYLVVTIAALRGYFAGHDPRLIFSDTIPYLFLLYFFPLKELLSQYQSPNPQFPISNFQFPVYAAIIGNFLLIALTFIGFSSGLFELQDPYYHWYRDVALGKITELPFHFYRIVINEHLLLVPVILWLLNCVITSPSRAGRSDPLAFQNPVSSEKKGIAPTASRGPDFDVGTTFLGLLAMTLLIFLSINLTRIYLLALIVGYLFLFTKQYWKRWLTVGFVSCFLFLVSFTSIHLIASRGQSLGLELFGLRLQSIVQPNIEESSLSRKLLLPKIIEKIKQQPLLGTGLGDTVTVYSPVFKQKITTPHFDWGYLEIIAEIGILGLLAWLALLASLSLPLLTKERLGEVVRWPFASFVALLVINLTSPALFHVLGIIWITYLLAVQRRTQCVSTVESAGRSASQLPR